jgi:GntR family transcriptional regulator
VQIVLSKQSEIPLREQIAEQIVYLIRTGQLRTGAALPSVRTLGRQSGVHHNTVSEAYQELVRLGFIARRPGSRLVVGASPGTTSAKPHDLDELINETIQRALDMGYSLQSLRLRTRERLLAQPPDHLLVVDQEAGLRNIIMAEVHESLGWLAQGCSYDALSAEPGLAIGAQVLVAQHRLDSVKPLVSPARPPTGIIFSQASGPINQINNLKNPSVVAIVSVSELLLKTARSLLAPAIGSRHSLNVHLLQPGSQADPGAADLVICDTIALPMVRARRKIHYRVVSEDCLAHIATLLTRP